MKTLIVLNAQNAFLDEDGAVYLGDKAEVLRVRLMDYASGFNGQRIFFREKHMKRDKFFMADVTHSIATTKEYKIHEDLKPCADVFYDKTCYSAFFRTGLDDYLKRQKASEVEVVGVETHTSVLFTAEELRNRGYDVTVVEALTASRDDHLHGFAISVLRNSLGVRIA